jgi:hypothetical protein
LVIVIPEFKERYLYDLSEGIAGDYAAIHYDTSAFSEMNAFRNPLVPYVSTERSIVRLS